MREFEARALVDYFNVANLRKGISLNYRDYEDGLWRIVDRLGGVMARFEPPPVRLRVRLYGGWFGTDGNTEAYDLLGAAVRKSSFPSRRIIVELAVSLVGTPDIRLVPTFRSLPGLPKFHTMTEPQGCVLKQRCSLASVNRWQRGKCPERSCYVLEDEAFFRPSQKMVDCAITCDAIHIASAEPDTRLIIVTDDDDIIPAVLLTARMRNHICQLRTARKHARYFDDVLQSEGVALHDW
jgi:hypothetical protein